MIRVLDKIVADKIAAGEVIERPISIVKELVENSIDSGADSIIVEIKKGGKTYIRVTDNGCGIPDDEAETAFLRHATSKITTAKDLDAIETLGFRGEALASIAAVTHTELITKTAESKSGVRLLIHGGEVISNGKTGCPDGTTFVITDLFYNTPARLKFMKSDSAESSQIIEFMSMIALAFPQIRFRFINNGNIVFSTTGQGDLLSTILSVYKLSEYKDLVPVDFSSFGNRVTGYISKPSLSRTSRRNQVFFVNGRVVSSKVIEKGVNEGYKERLFEGRFPVCFLFIHTNPEKLDVNIHPNKKEVRFDDEHEIINLVSAGIVNALLRNSAVIEAKAKDVKNYEPQVKAIVQTQATADMPKADAPKIVEPAEPVENVKKAEPIEKAEQVDIKQILSSKPPRVAEKVIEPDRPLINIDAPVNKPFDFDNLNPTGAIFNTYITATDDNGFYLIDQHAAHERVFYEKLVGEYLADEKPRQPILTPIIIETAPSVIEMKEEWLGCLEEMGFDIDEFGGNSLVVREIPTFMSMLEAENFVREYLDSAADGGKTVNTVVVNKLITKSCKAAIKAHDHLSIAEIESLLNQLKACRNPFSCPHGRPTFIRFTKYEIEKMFKRV
ncbi:MAG: DNA mismatch repair endonuclease MutL [Clostridia bacterium]|nr:DNA mismatch repair endonuclease MutL [Clostridia bacterium]